MNNNKEFRCGSFATSSQSQYKTITNLFYRFKSVARARYHLAANLVDNTKLLTLLCQISYRSSFKFENMI